MVRLSFLSFSTYRLFANVRAATSPLVTGLRGATYHRTPSIEAGREAMEAAILDDVVSVIQ